MATGPMTLVVRHLCNAVLLPDAQPTDGLLLEAFIARRDEAAFAALVRRHGPMVLGVCRRVLGNVHDAEDAFQAAFLVLARKAASVRPRELVGHWLYGVAFRTALKARALAARRQARERQVREMPEREAPREEAWSDLQPLLDHELSRLPEKYRVPLVLCELEGKSKREVARHLGLPEGTVSSRLVRARQALRRRLSRRGLTLSAGALAVALSELGAPAAVPGPLMLATVKAAAPFAAGGAAAVPAPVAALTEGVLKAMLLTKLKIGAAFLLALGALALGMGVIAHRAWAEPAATASPEPSGNAAGSSRTRPLPPAVADEKDKDDKPDRKPGEKGKADDAGDKRSRAEEVVTKSFKTKGSPRLVVETFNGAITVTTGDKDVAKATVTKSSRDKTEKAAAEDLKNIEVTMAQEGDTIRVKARQTEQSPQGNRGAAVDLQVPPGSAVELHTSNGPVTVRGATGDVTAATSNGAVHAEGGKGKLHLTTKNGAIHAEGGTGQVEARTSNGEVTVKATDAVVTAHTSNGSIHFTGKLGKGEHSFETHNGSIALALPKGSQFRLDARTSHGTITSGFPLEGKDEKRKNSLQGTVGEKPAATIKLRTSNGNIDIRPEE
jgi:RNA polymerase sigma factor (sigma-70 family)